MRTSPDEQRASVLSTTRPLGDRLLCSAGRLRRVRPRLERLSPGRVRFFPGFLSQTCLDLQYELLTNIQPSTTNEQAVALCDLVERYNAAGAWLSECAWAHNNILQCLEVPQAGPHSAGVTCRGQQRC